jgi:hypothetical protein
VLKIDSFFKKMASSFEKLLQSIEETFINMIYYEFIREFPNFDEFSKQLYKQKVQNNKQKYFQRYCENILLKKKKTWEKEKTTKNRRVYNACVLLMKATSQISQTIPYLIINCIDKKDESFYHDCISNGKISLSGPNLNEKLTWEYMFDKKKK